MIKIHGHALLLDSRSNQTGPLPHLMETRYNKPGKLFYQTSPVAPPQVNAENLPPYRAYCRENIY